MLISVCFILVFIFIILAAIMWCAAAVHTDYDKKIDDEQQMLFVRRHSST